MPNRAVAQFAFDFLVEASFGSPIGPDTGIWFGSAAPYAMLTPLIIARG